MLQNLCITLYLAAGLNTYPGADIHVTPGQVNASVKNIVGVNIGPMISVQSRACHMPLYVLDSERAYKKLTPEQKQMVINHQLFDK